MKNLSIGIAVVLSLVAVGLGLVRPTAHQNVGGSTTILEEFSQGIRVNLLGTGNGTAITNLIVGTCNPSQAVAGSQAASSTAQFLCTVTGARSGDRVFISLPAGSRTSTGQWFGNSNGYATTSDRIGFDMTNFSGAASSSFAQATTGVQYTVIRTTTNP